MGRPKGGKNRYYTTEFKMKMMKELETGESTRSLQKKYDVDYRLIGTWSRKYQKNGLDGLVNKKKPGNPFGGAYQKKFASEEDKLRYEIALKEVEIAKLKKLIEIQTKGESQKK